MKIRTDRANLDRVEDHLRPWFRSAITIPLVIDGAAAAPRQIAIYVTTSEFDLDPPTRAVLLAVAHEVAVRIDECAGDES